MMLTIQQMHTLLMRLSYPATPAQLAEDLRRQEAPAEVIERIRNLPEHYYGSVDSVIDALREPDEV